MSEKDTFVISVEFGDGSRVQLGGDDEFFVEPDEDTSSVKLDDFRLDLIKALQKVNRGDD